MTSEKNYQSIFEERYVLNSKQGQDANRDKLNNDNMTRPKKIKRRKKARYLSSKLIKTPRKANKVSQDFS